MNFGDFAVITIAVGLSAIFIASIWIDTANPASDDRPEPGRERAIDAALREGVVYRVALGRPAPYRARVEIGGRVYGFQTAREAAEWLAMFGVVVARSGEMLPHQYPEVVGGVEIGHPSLGGR